MLPHRVPRAQEIAVGAIKRCHVIALLGCVHCAANPLESDSRFLCDLVEPMGYDLERDGVFAVDF